MIIYIDTNGKENIIRSNELIKKLINENVITKDTLLKTEIEGDWILAKEFDLFKSIHGEENNTEIINNSENLIKELEEEYQKILIDPSLINEFQKKWNAKPVQNNNNEDSELMTNSKTLNQSELWLITINHNFLIYLGRTLFANLPVLIADNNRYAKDCFKNIFNIEKGESLKIIKQPVINYRDNKYIISSKGIINLPILTKKDEIKKTDQKLDKKIDTDLNDSKERKNIAQKEKKEIYIPKNSSVPKTGNINKKDTILKQKEIKKTEVNKTNLDNSNKKTTTNNIDNKNIIRYKKMGFGEAVKSCFNKYFDFKGRARRAELWYFVLFSILVSTSIALLELLMITVSFSYYYNYGVYNFFLFADWIFFLVTIIPSISVTFRRLHDINRSAWWLLLSFIIIIGWVVLFIWYCTDSQKEKNRFGFNPKIV